MSAERRLENKRMKVTKRMEISCLETGTNYVGETEDVSDSGIRANFDKSPKAGSNVMVKLFWDEEQNPVETFGRVAWSAPLPIGEGIEVGLMLGAEGDVYGKKEKKKKRTVTRYHKYKPTKSTQYVPFEAEWSAYDDSIENKRTIAAIPSPVQPIVSQEPEPVVLVKGESFKVSLRGNETWAKIETTEQIDANGQIHITLQIKDKYLWNQTKNERTDAPKTAPVDEVDDFDPKQWKAKPISNAYHTIKKYAAPPVHLTLKVLTFAIRLITPLTYLVWKKIPLTTRVKICDGFDLVKGHKAISQVRAAFSFTRNTSSKFVAKFAK